MGAIQNWASTQAQVAQSNTQSSVYAQYSTQPSGIRAMVSVAPATSIEYPVYEEQAKQVEQEKTETLISHRQQPSRVKVAQNADVEAPMPVVEPASSVQASSKVITTEPDITVVEFNDYLMLEIRGQNVPRTIVIRAIARLLTTPEHYAFVDLTSGKAFDSVHKPYFYGRVLDARQRPIRYPGQAYDYAKQLLSQQKYQPKDIAEAVSLVKIPLQQEPQLVESQSLAEPQEVVVSSALDSNPYDKSAWLSNPSYVKALEELQALKQELSLQKSFEKLDQYLAKVPEKAHGFLPWVSLYAKQFDIEPALILAIMEVESAFNPQARSQSNALGLMQIMRSTAGRDVNELIDNKATNPTEQELLDPENNIRMGVGYLSLLKNLYFSQVENEGVRELLMISSYNGGLNSVLKLFDRNPDVAVSKINQMTPQQVYQTLRHQHPAQETRNYLQKVLTAKQNLTI